MNPYQLQAQDHRFHVERNTDNGIAPPESTGFFENMRTAFGDYHSEEASTSEFFNRKRTQTPRNEMAQRLIASGDIPEDVVNANRIVGRKGGSLPDYNGLAEWRQAQGFDDLESDEQIHAELRQELAERRETSQDIYERSTMAGTGGQFAGYLLGGSIDPVNIAAMAIPISAPVAAGARVGATAARVGASAAAANMAAEALIQGQVIGYKDDIDSPYSVGMAAANVAFAGAFGAALGGGSAAWRQGSINRNITNESLHDLHTARELTVQGPPERQAIDGAITEIDPTFTGIADELGMDRMAEVSARANDLPDRQVELSDGVVTSTKAEAEKQGKIAEDIEKITTCMFGGASG